MKTFKNKNIVITGASSGIGREVAIDFSKRGAKTIILISRDRRKLENVASIIGNKSESMICECDISQRAEVLGAAERILKTYGSVDILVNNAGIGMLSEVKDQSLDDIEKITATNYYGMIYCTKSFLNSMLHRKTGHIVNVASLAASFGMPGLAAYCGSKFAMLGFSESLYHELHGTGVGVTVVSPIGVDTAFFEHKSFGGQYYNRKFFLKPSTVSNAIVRASTSRRLEIVVPFFMRGAVWLKQTIPYLVNPFVATTFKTNID